MERFDKVLMASIQVSAWLTGVTFICWGALLFAAQALAWIRFGMWQPIPAFVAFMQPHDQMFQTVPLGLFEASWSPLQLTPSIAGFSSSEAISAAVCGNLLGLVKIVSSLLELPLSLWFLALGAGCLVIASSISESERKEAFRST